ERHIQKLERQRRKLLELHYADAVPADLFKDEQTRISRELAVASAVIQRQAAGLQEVEGTLAKAIAAATNCQGAYRAASPSQRRQMNQAFFEAIWITEEGITRSELAEPFASLVGYTQSSAESLTAAVDREACRRANAITTVYCRQSLK